MRSLLATSQSVIDPLQFAYQAGKGVEDAMATLPDQVVGHLEGTKTHVSASFIDFAFSEIPDIVGGSIGWLVGRLARRPQRVCGASCHHCYLYRMLTLVEVHLSPHP